MSITSNVLLVSGATVMRTGGTILTSDGQFHSDTSALILVNNVIGAVNYVTAARPPLLNFMIADIVQRPQRT
jgi:hypothetical protein